MYKLWNNKEFIDIQYHQIPWNLYCIGRLDGPTIISHDAIYYYFKGLLHRINGPAIIHKNYKTFWLNGKRFENISDYLKNNKFINEAEKILIYLKYS